MSRVPITTYKTHRVRNGSISIGHRPRFKHIPAMRKNGITHVVSILSEREEARKLGQSILRERMEWIWIPIGSSKPPEGRDVVELVRQAFAELEEALEAEANIFIHCSAGIHRTGMIANALLLYLGYSQEEAGSILSELRAITSENVSEARLEWGRRFIRK